MYKVTIADDEFLPYGKSAYLGGDNVGVGPTHFEWEAADPQTARFVTDRNIKHARGEGQVAWLLEPFFLHPENYLDAMKKPFDAVLTHSRYFADNTGWIWVPHGGSWVDFNLWKIHPKSRNVSIIVSGKDSTRGHRMRREVAERYGDRVTVFGMDKFTRTFDCISDYRYSIVIENEKCPGYFTEKLIDCLSVGTIPIYCGNPYTRHMFNSKGMICVDEVQDIGYAIEYIDDVGEISYDARLQYIAHNLDIASQYSICEDWIFARYPELFGVMK